MRPRLRGTPVIVVALTLGALLSPAGGATFSARYGGEGAEEMEGLIEVSTGGFLVVGWSDSFSSGGDGDAWVLRLDEQGGVLWQRAYGGPGDDMAIDAAELSDGSFLIAGWTQSFGAGQTDAWVIRIDAQGNLLWQRAYGGADDEQAWSVVPRRQGDVLITGGTLSFGAGGADAWVLVIDEQGGVVWSKTYGGAADDGGGGSYDEFVVRGREDGAGNIYVVTETASFGHGGTDVWVIKLDGTGSVLWQKAYGGPLDETMWDVALNGGGLVVPGVTESFSPDQSGDAWALGLDDAGGILWQRVYTLPGVWNEVLSVAPLAAGGALLGAYFEEGTTDWDLYLVRLDAEGAPQWNRRFEYGWDWPNALVERASGELVMAGVAWARDQGVDQDLWLMRLDASGQLGQGCTAPDVLSLGTAVTTSSPLDTAAQVTTVVPTATVTTGQVMVTASAPMVDCTGPAVPLWSAAAFLAALGLAGAAVGRRRSGVG